MSLMSVEHCGTYGRLAILEMCTTLQTKDGQVCGESFCVLISHLCTILTLPLHSSNSSPPPSSTAQGMIAEMVSQLFEIEHGYFGNILSNLAKVWKMYNPIGVTFPRHFIDIPPPPPTFLHLIAAHGKCNGGIKREAPGTLVRGMQSGRGYQHTPLPVH